MLRVNIPASEYYDETQNLFVETKEFMLSLEHSLVSLSKWEEKWQKPFLTKTPKSYEETTDYIKCMTITQNVPDSVYLAIPKSVLDEISNYIENPMTATTFTNQRGSADRSIITAEIIYYQMIALQIPFECQKWHLNKLLTLIKVCNIKNEPPKKYGKKDLNSYNKALNAARQKQYNTTG